MKRVLILLFFFVYSHSDVDKIGSEEYLFLLKLIDEYRKKETNENNDANNPKKCLKWVAQKSKNNPNPHASFICKCVAEKEVIFKIIAKIISSNPVDQVDSEETKKYPFLKKMVNQYQKEVKHKLNDPEEFEAWMEMVKNDPVMSEAWLKTANLKYIYLPNQLKNCLIKEVFFGKPSILCSIKKTFYFYFDPNIINTFKKTEDTNFLTNRVREYKTILTNNISDPEECFEWIRKQSRYNRNKEEHCIQKALLYYDLILFMIEKYLYKEENQSRKE